MEAESEGEDIVARRFTKTANRQEAGLRALLQLSDEEQTQTAPAPSNLHETSSSRLLKLLLNHSKGRTLFQDSLSNILREETHGIAGLRALAMEDMEAMSLLDPCLLAKFVRRTLQNAQVGLGRWYDAAAFLDFMLRPLWWPSPLTKDLAEVVFDEVTKAFDPQTRHTATSTTRDDHAVRAVALRATYSSCLFATRENSDPSGRIPSYLPQALFPLISTDPVTGDQGRAMATGLAIISMVLNFPLLAPSGDRGSPFEIVDEFADTCIHVMLGSTAWQFRIQEGTDVEGFPKLRPDEDAFDVLCRLPAPTFENALGRLIERARKHVKAEELTLVSRLLSSLLWLSLRSLHISQAHRALVGSGVCDFLFEVIKWTVPQESDYQYRDICRVKGDALTCLGNICEAMGAEDLEATLSKDMLNSILSIRDSKTMPTVQIGQAAFTVQRYLAACTRGGVAPCI